MDDEVSEVRVLPGQADRLLDGLGVLEVQPGLGLERRHLRDAARSGGLGLERLPLHAVGDVQEDRQRDRPDLKRDRGDEAVADAGASRAAPEERGQASGGYHGETIRTSFSSFALNLIPSALAAGRLMTISGRPSRTSILAASPAPT